MQKRDIVQLLKEKQINPTVQRVEIAHFLLSKPQHLSADEVMMAINKSYHQVSKATVYNTLGLFVEKGLVREVLVDAERVLYDSNTKPHHHLYNVDTCELIDVDESCIALKSNAFLPENTELAGTDFVIKIKNSVH